MSENRSGGIGSLELALEATWRENDKAPPGRRALAAWWRTRTPRCGYSVRAFAQLAVDRIIVCPTLIDTDSRLRYSDARQTKEKLMSSSTVKISLRLDGTVHASLEVIAGKEAMSTEALIQRILTLHVIRCAREAGTMDPTEIDRLERERDVIGAVIRRALELDEQGRFTEHFTLTVFRDLIADTAFRSDYETVIGGDAYESRLPGKFPLNMNLGRYIKNAIPGAVPLRDPKGRPRRVQVRNEPIQSYTLLTKAGGQ